MSLVPALAEGKGPSEILHVRLFKTDSSCAEKIKELQTEQKRETFALKVDAFEEVQSQEVQPQTESTLRASGKASDFEVQPQEVHPQEVQPQVEPFEQIVPFCPLLIENPARGIRKTLALFPSPALFPSFQALLHFLSASPIPQKGTTSNLQGTLEQKRYNSRLYLLKWMRLLRQARRGRDEESNLRLTTFIEDHPHATFLPLVQLLLEVQPRTEKDKNFIQFLYGVFGYAQPATAEERQLQQALYWVGLFSPQEALRSRLMDILEFPSSFLSSALYELYFHEKNVSIRHRLLGLLRDGKAWDVLRRLYPEFSRRESLPFQLQFLNTLNDPSLLPVLVASAQKRYNLNLIDYDNADQMALLGQIIDKLLSWGKQNPAGEVQPREVQPQVAPDALSFLQRLCFDRRIPWMLRHNALHDFVTLAGPSSLPALLKLLKDPDKDIRLHVVQFLGNLENPLATTPLEQIIEKDPSSLVRAYAVEALQRMVGLSATAFLEKQRLREASPFPQEAILSALLKNGVHPSLTPLLDYLHRPPGFLLEDKLARALAIETLRDYGDDTILPLLVRLIPQEPDWQVFVLLHRALEKRTGRRYPFPPSPDASLQTRVYQFWEKVLDQRKKK